MPVCIVGSEEPGHTSKTPIRADVKFAIDKISVAFKGPQTEAQLRSLYSRSSVYAATSRYEPFGMGALEAALSRCAIVANDIPTFREIWGESALYFRTNDAESLAETIQLLARDRGLCRAHGNLAYQRARERFTAKRMIEQYLQVYRGMIRRTAAA
jgi:glycosyltransferase involved in cell wall biosynthesis